MRADRGKELPFHINHQKRLGNEKKKKDNQERLIDHRRPFATFFFPKKTGNTQLLETTLTRPQIFSKRGRSQSESTQGFHLGFFGGEFFKRKKQTYDFFFLVFFFLEDGGKMKKKIKKVF